jgi:glyoxylase-like metal-dependent hydrolase (beta-lactamase superfamily II)
VLAHPTEAERMGRVDGMLADGETITAGDLEIATILTPGHSPGHLSFLVNGTDCFTADVLFHGTVGGTMRDSYESLHHSIMDVLMHLPHETAVHPGHTDPTTIGAEWEENVFIRLWRGVDPAGEEPCTVNGRPGILELFAPDYDGGHKGLVRWEDGTHDVVPGSRVVKGGSA